MAEAVSLAQVYDGWDGYNTSLIRAIAPRTPAELAYRAAPSLRSVGEIAAHIGLGRIDWFHRMGAPGSKALAEEVAALEASGEGPLLDRPSLTEDAGEIVRWLEKSWGMIDGILHQWTVDDLAKTFHLKYWGKTFAIPYQWVLWRMLTHDVQHGGQLTVLLWQQGLKIVDLGDLGGHLTEPPIVEEG